MVISPIPLCKSLISNSTAALSDNAAQGSSFCSAAAPTQTQSNSTQAPVHSIISCVERQTQLDSALPQLGVRLTSSTVSGLHESEYPAWSAPLPLSAHTHTLALPKCLQSALDACQPDLLDVGLFVDIDVVWATALNVLHLWPRGCTAPDSVVQWSAHTDTILCVCVAPARDGLFHACVTHVLCVCTSRRVLLLALVVSACDGLQVLPEPAFAVEADTLTVTCVCCADNSRFLLAGADGHIYELVYGVTGWLSSRATCHLADVSRGWLSYLFAPWFVTGLTGTDPIIQLAVGADNSTLYSRSQSGTIVAYRLEKRAGAQLCCLGSLSEASLRRRCAETASTVAQSCFAHVVTMYPLDSYLVVVTQSGARMFLDSTLELLHVRLAPGLTSHQTAALTGDTGHALCLLDRHTHVLFTCRRGSDASTLMFLCGHLTPECSRFVEVISELSLPTTNLLHVSCVTTAHTDTLIVVCVYEDRICLETFEARSPRSTLAGLLALGGADLEADVRPFLTMHGDRISAYLCTLIVCMQSETAHDMEISRRAIALLVCLARRVELTSFRPRLVSTPQRAAVNTQSILALNSSTNPSAEPTSFQFLHDTICLYVSRSLSTLWNSPLLSTPLSQIDEAFRLLSALQRLYSMIDGSFTAHLLDGSSGNTAAVPDFYSVVCNAAANPHNFFTHLFSFASYVSQMLDLVRIVTDYDITKVCAHMDADRRSQLHELTWSGLLSHADCTQTCSLLISSLVDHFLSDQALTGRVTDTLRARCPLLFRPQDSISVQVTELLQRAATRPGEREMLVSEAMTLCRQIADTVNLAVICRQLKALNCYSQVFVLVEFVVRKRDPNNTASKYYSNNSPTGDVEGSKFMEIRNECYKLLVDTLSEFYHRSSTGDTDLRLSPTNATMEAGKAFQQYLDQCLQSDDTLLHMAIYGWMYSDLELRQQLVQIQTKSVVEFLHREVATRPTEQSLDTLWRLYERRSNFLSAARILSRLAELESDVNGIKQRIEFLARAILCLRSAVIQSSRDDPGLRSHSDFYCEVEEKLEVARIQSMIHDAVQATSRGANSSQTTYTFSSPTHESHSDTSQHQHTEQARAQCSQLNTRLFDLTALYRVCEQWRLFTCKLAVLHCAGHADRQLVAQIWRDIIGDAECGSPSAHPSASAAPSMPSLHTHTITQCVRRYVDDSDYLPLDVVVVELETRRVGEDDGWTLDVLLDGGVPLSQLFDVYSRLCDTVDDVTMSTRLTRSLINLMSRFANNPSLVPHTSVQLLKSKCLSKCSQCVVDMSSRVDCQHHLKLCEQVHAKLTRIQGLP